MIKWTAGFVLLLYLSTTVVRAQDRAGIASEHQSSADLPLNNDPSDSTKAKRLLDRATDLIIQMPDSAIPLAKEALSLCEDAGWRQGAGQSHLLLANAYKIKIEYPAALREAFKANETFTGMEALPGANKPALKLFQWRALSCIGLVYCLKGDYPIALKYCNEALSKAEDIGNKPAIGNSYNSLGTIYKEEGDYPAAMDYFFKAMKLADETNDKPLLMQSWIYVAGIYVFQNEHRKALDYLFKALKIAEQSTRPNICPIMGNIANAYHKAKNNDSAIIYCNRMLALGPQYLNKYYKAGIWFLLGEISEEQEKQEPALKYYKDALKLYTGTGDKKGQASAHIGIGKVYTALQNYPDAERNLRQALAISGSIGSGRLKGDAEKAISVLYEKTGNEHDAFAHYKAAVALRDSLFNDERNRALTRKTLTYEYDKKEAIASAAQRQKVLLEEAKTQKFRIIALALIVSFALLLLLIFYIVRQSKLRRRLDAEQMRNRLSRDLHDDIGSTLSSINMLSRTAQRNLAESGDEKAKASLEKMSERSQRLLDNMSDIIWNIHPGNDTIEELMSRMREYASTILEAKEIPYKFDFPEGRNEMKLSMDLKNNLFLIFKEAVNNIAKYSACKQATLSLRTEDKMIHLRIADDGVGFDIAALDHIGGLRNMKQRAEEMKGVLTIISRRAEGTMITLIVPRG